jgi:hypothetical protein
MLDKLSRLFDLIVAISKLPVARLEFRLEFDPDNVEKFYEYFTMRHPRYKIFQNKALGAALVDLAKFQTRAEYMETIKGRNSAEHHARRARNKGYRVVEINKNDYVDQLHEINNSVGVRQGRPMDAAYREKQTHYTTDKSPARQPRQCGQGARTVWRRRRREPDYATAGNRFELICRCERRRPTPALPGLLSESCRGAPTRAPMLPPCCRSV